MSQATHKSYAKSPFQRALVNNSTDVTFPTIAATTTAPATVDSTTPTANLFVGQCGGTELLIIPFGTDAANEQFHMRVTLFKQVRIGSLSTATLTLYVPYSVGTFECTTGALTGVASSPVAATENFCDTVTEVGTTWDDNFVTVKSPVDDITALIRIDTRGYDLFQVDFDMDAAGGTDAVGCNFIYATEGP